MTSPQEAARLFLDICRGETSYPSRPVVAGRFLIGSGPHCDLRLGGTAVPPLHSVIRDDAGAMRIESQVTEPPLVINGERRRTAILHDGDRISIGVFEFSVRFPAEPANSGAIEAMMKSALARHAAGQHAAGETEESRSRIEAEAREFASQLTAEELVNQIAREEAELEEEENRREQGTRALLESVLARASKLTGRELPKLPALNARDGKLKRVLTADPYFAEELPARRNFGESHSIQELVIQVQRLVERVEGLTLRMEDRLDRFVERENRQLATAEEMNLAQSRLLERLETLVGRLQGPSTVDPPSVRVVA